MRGARGHDVAQRQLRLFGDQRQPLVGQAAIGFQTGETLEHRAVARQTLADFAQCRRALALAFAAFGGGEQIGDLVGFVAREGGVGAVARAEELAHRQAQLGQAAVDFGGGLGGFLDRAQPVELPADFAHLHDRGDVRGDQHGDERAEAQQRHRQDRHLLARAAARAADMHGRVARVQAHHLLRGHRLGFAVALALGVRFAADRRAAQGEEGLGRFAHPPPWPACQPVSPRLSKDASRWASMSAWTGLST